MEYPHDEHTASELAYEALKQGYSRREFVKRSGALGVSGLLGLSGLLAACGNVKPQTEQGRAASGTPVPQATSQFSLSDANGLQWPKSIIPEPASKVQITVAHAWEAAFWPRQLQFDQLFMKRHPNITVNAENTPWSSFLQKYVAQAAGGTLPDLIYCHFSWAQVFIQQGILQHLDDYISRQTDFNIADFTRPAQAFYQKNGSTYGIGYDCGPLVLFYNKTLFDKAGIGYPTENWTLDDLKQAAIKLTSGSGSTRIFGLQDTPSPASADVAPPYLFPFGARYVNGTKCVIDQPAAVSAMNWWMDLRFKYKAVPTTADATAMSQQGGAFTAGRAAMMLNGSWAVPGLNQQANFKWDLVGWPKGPIARATSAEGSAYTISANSPQKDAAWIYLNEYLSSAGQSFMWAMTGRGSPTRKSAWDAYFKSKFAPPGAKYVLAALESYATNDILYGPHTSQISDTATPIWDRVVAGQLSVQDGLTQVSQKVTPLLAQQ